MILCMPPYFDDHLDLLLKSGTDCEKILWPNCNSLDFGTRQTQASSHTSWGGYVFPTKLKTKLQFANR